MSSKRTTGSRALVSACGVLLPNSLPGRGQLCRTGCGQQLPRPLRRIVPVKDGTAGDQQLRPCFDDGGNRVVSHPAVHLDAEAQVALCAQLAQMANLLERKR